MNSVLTNCNVEDVVRISLLDYISQHISCRPYSEYRHNINLRPIFATVKSNVVSIRGMSLPLPTSGRWYLYYVDDTVLMDVRLPNTTEWVCLADKTNKKGKVTGFCSEHKLDIRLVIDSTGCCIPRGYVYVIKNPSENNFIFAIYQDVVRALKPRHTEIPSDIWLNIYYHHIDSEFTITHYSAAVEKERLLFLKIYNQEQNIAFLNGEVVTEELVDEDVKNTDYIEIVHDSNLVGSVDSELEESYYNSSRQPRILVHIPKQLNPDNDIINHRVCDFVLLQEGKKTGKYINRSNTTKMFFTLTHNDFGVDTMLLEKYQEISKDPYALRTYVRNHKKTGLMLDRDSHYLSCLYRLNDELILDNLLGKTSMTIWSASELESNSPYSYIVDKYFEDHDLNKFDDWFKCLGYATATDVSCKRVFHMLATPDLLHKFYIALPIYYVGKKVTAHVYLNGRLLDPDHVRCENDEQFLKIQIDPCLKFSDDFKNRIPVTIGNYLRAQHYDKRPYFTVEIFENPDYRAGIYTLDKNQTATIYVDQDFDVYCEAKLDNINKLPDHYIYKRFNFKTSYRKLTTSEINAMITSEDIEDTNLRKITLTNIGSKNTFIISSSHAYAKVYGVELQLKEMNYDIFCSHPLVAKAKPWVDYDEEEQTIVESKDHIYVPYLSTDNELLVYLNHRELTKDLDYRIYQAKTKAGCICAQFVISQNVDYLNVAGNTFEVYTVSEHNTLSTSGFLTDGRPTFESYYSLFPNSGILFTDGLVFNYSPKQAKQESTIVGYDTVLHDTIRKGASAKLRAMMPLDFSKLVEIYNESIDLQNIDRVTNYMSSIEYDLEAPAIIERSHHIYSTFLQTVIELVLRNLITYSLKWTDQDIRDALKPYESMLQYDIGLSEDNIEVTDPDQFIKPPESGIDFRFVDVLPTYRIASIIPDLIIPDKYPLLVIQNSNMPTVNGNYICVNPDVAYPRTGDANEKMVRVWKNENGAYILHQDLYDIGMYWILNDENGIIQYRAKDVVGDDTIWEMNWESVNGGSDITITPIRIEINTAGEFLARRLSYTLHTQDREFLTRVAKIYLNKDLVLDGVNIT